MDFWGKVGGGEGMLPPPSQIIGGPGPLFLRLCSGICYTDAVVEW